MTGTRIVGAESPPPDTAERSEPAASPSSGVAGRVSLRRIVSGAVVGIGAVQVALGVLWWFGNLGMVPAYGDSVEYLELSQSLEVDGYRTLAFPLLLRVSSHVATWAGLPYQVPLYLLQTALAVAVAWYLVRTASSMSRGRAALATALIATSPLVLHYALSVLSDSIAASLLVLALAGLARVVVRGDRRVRTWLLTFSGALGTALMRTEKWYVLLTLAVLVLGGLAVARYRGRGLALGSLRSVAAAVAVLLVVPAVLATVGNRMTQTADFGRPDSLVTSIATGRIVWGHLVEIRDELPASARARISPEAAAAFDADPSSILTLISLMHDADGGGNAVTSAAVRASLGCCALGIAASTARDAAQLAFAPIAFSGEATSIVVTGAPAGTPMEWNLTRMSAAHPASTHLLVGVSLLLVIALAVASASGRLPSADRAARRATRTRNQVLLLAWIGTLVNSCFFALAGGGVEANVRYGLSSATTVMCALVVWALAPGRDLGPEPTGQNAVRHSRERRPTT
jgi:hypothetical protein